MPRISVITPTFNRSGVLLRAIRSVQNQTFPDYEHIVIDDGSTDDTRDIVASLDDDRIRYFAFPENLGANTARNAAIDLVRSPLVTFLDSDDEYRPHRLAATVEWLSRHEEIDLLLSSFVTVKRGVESRCDNPEAYLGPAMFERALISHVVFIAGSAITVRLDALRAVGAFDTTLHRLQDRDLLLKLARSGGTLTTSDVDWIKHESRDSISRPIAGYVRAFAELVRRHPQTMNRYRELVTYMVARNILRALLRARPDLALFEYHANLRDQALNLSPAALISGYSSGKRMRRQIAEEIRHAGPAGSDPAPAGPAG